MNSPPGESGEMQDEHPVDVNRVQPNLGYSSSMWLWVKTNATILGFSVHRPFLVYCSGDWDVHWGDGILTHGHVFFQPKFGRHRCPV